MPRPLRIEFENAWYHVMNRGAGHQDIYKSVHGRYHFLELLEKSSKLFGIEIHAYCLMDNHYHLLVRTPHANLSCSMQYISGNYTKQLNRTENSDGPLFRSRYKAIVVDSDAYLLQVSRYIHLNPVVAYLVKTAAEYKWSSYFYYLKGAYKPDWLHIDEILSMVSNTKNPKFYKDFVEADVDCETNKFYSKKNLPVIFGSKEFKEKLLSKLEKTQIESAYTDYRKVRNMPTMDNIIEKCVSFFGIEENELYQNHRGKRNLAREIAIYGCRVWAAEKAWRVAYRFKCSRGNISNIFNKIIGQLRIDEKLRVIINQFEACCF